MAGWEGTAAAVALTRAGIGVRVYEQAARLAEVGAGVSLAPNGLRMLDRLDVGDAVARLGARHVATQLRLPDGRPADYQPHQFARAGSNVGIHRADLLALLVEQLPPGTVRTGHCCTGFGQDAGQAVVSFANGASDTADVVIGGGRHPFGDAPLGGYLAGWAIESMAIVTASIRTGSWSGLISTP